jgi:SOS-response transcriptional repressor LexA
MVRKGGSCLNYYELLNKMIEESKLTHKEIAEKCMEYGVRINPSYISKLRTGKQPPASDDVNIAIAKACGFEQSIDNFLYEAYIEKAPSYIKVFLQEIVALFRKVIRDSFTNQFPSEMRQLLIEQIEQMSDYEIIKQSIGQLKLLLNSKNGDIDQKENQLVLRMTDESMEPKIPRGSTIYIIPTEEIRNGDIVVVSYKGQKRVCRIFFIEKKVVLVSDNNKFEPIIEEQNNITIEGKVSHIMIEV